MGDLQGKAEKNAYRGKGVQPSLLRRPAGNQPQRDRVSLCQDQKSPPRLALLQSSTSFKIEFPTKKLGFQEMSALLQVLKSLSHGSEDMKPLEKHERRSPGPQTPGHLVFSIKTGSRSSLPAASKWWLTNNKARLSMQGPHREKNRKRPTFGQRNI